MSQALILKNKHLVIGHELINDYFGEVSYVFVKWIKESNHLLVAPQTASVFYQVHKDAMQMLLKTKNLQGDKSIALYDFFYENNINENDNYDVEYHYLDKLKALKIKMI